MSADTAYCTWTVYIGSQVSPPEYCDEEVSVDSEYCPTHQMLSDDLDRLEYCRCGHMKKQHQGPEGLGGEQCRACPEDGERMWRHPFTPNDMEG